VELALPLRDYADLVALRAPFVSPPPAGSAERVALTAELVADVRESVEADVDRAGQPSGDGAADLRRELTALLTVRPPDPFPDGVLDKLDRLFAGEAAERPVVDTDSLDCVGEVSGTSLCLWRGDITTLGADAIVNAANSALLGCRTPFHRCIDNAIHAAAGPRLRADSAVIIAAQGNGEPTGHAKVTRGYHLPARYVLHTVGPIVEGPVLPWHRDLLASCYRACLDAAAEVGGVGSVALCGISTGAFGFPAREAVPVAVRAVRSWLTEHPAVLERVVFDVYSQDDFASYAAVLT
jgi:O-acetyl-ADP-ribose deacetylase (regulator of RNase III)